MPSVSEKLDETAAILRDSDVVDPRREAASLLAIALKRNRTFLVAHPEYLLNPDEESIVDRLIQRRASHEPFQYISGIQEFYGLEFEVTPDVLIPRPETEMVVEHAIRLLDEFGAPSICEVGIGSGCIAISILHQKQDAIAVGLDISPAALAVARRNAQKHGVDSRLTLLESDIFGGLETGRFCMIVSNPPYVPRTDLDGLQAEVRDFEPRLALTDGSDGLSIIRRIIGEAPRVLMPGGHLLMEIGFNQSQQVADMFEKKLWRSPILYPDLQGIPRLVLSQLI
ncbi:MAG TPA: peptide chain release factor N(5)-glutamine methyltransferase [Pyrinomonadaceae bacterium]